MKSVIALAFAAGALAVPAWSDAPVKETSTTTSAVSKTWEDVSSTTPADPEKTWVSLAEIFGLGSGLTDS